MILAQLPGACFARLGCTRIGSPGIFGAKTRRAICGPAKMQVTVERLSAACPVNATAR
jgi:hypothetical protein